MRPQPSPVEALSACNVSTGTPVAVEILSRFAPREATVPNNRRAAAKIKLNVFISIKTPLGKGFDFGEARGSLYSEKNLLASVVDSKWVAARRQNNNPR